jgi:hypothetical protein
MNIRQIRQLLEHKSMLGIWYFSGKLVAVLGASKVAFAKSDTQVSSTPVRSQVRIYDLSRRNGTVLLRLISPVR